MGSRTPSGRLGPGYWSVSITGSWALGVPHPGRGTGGLVLTGHMTVIVWWQHACGVPIWSFMSPGDAPGPFNFMFLLLWTWGAGTWSVDAWRKGRSSAV